MSRPAKILVGVLTAVPLLATAAGLVHLLGVFSEVAASNGSIGPGQFGDSLRTNFVFTIIGTAAALVLLAFFLWHLLGRDGPAQKLLWVVLLVVLSPIAMPAYWFLHVWPDAASRRRGTAA